MKQISFFLIFILFILISKISYSEDALTIKQQLDRVVEEVKDLNKAVFNKSFDKESISSNEKENDTEKFSSIDIRIYDLEKDIKNLTLQLEEIFFKLNDLSKDVYSIESNLINKIEKIQINFNTKNTQSNSESPNSILVKEENTLGKLVISNNNEDESPTVSDSLTKKNTDNETKKKLVNLNPEEQLQLALDQMMKKNYDKSKNILEKFIVNFPDNQLSGSAHFWLGKIYLFETNYRKAAIVFGEGVQKFPQSIKAAEMYYELAKSLKEMNKIPEACKTLYLLEENYKKSKFIKDPEKIKTKLNCENKN